MLRERLGEPPRRVVTPREDAVAVGGYERQRGPRGSDDLDDGFSRSVHQPAEPAVLPGGDEGAHGVLVNDRRPRLPEREAAAGAVAAAADRPGRRSAAAVAERRLDPREEREAPLAELRAALGADHASLREQQLEHGSTLRAEPSRGRVSSAKTPGRPRPGFPSSRC